MALLAEIAPPLNLPQLHKSFWEIAHAPYVVLAPRHLGNTLSLPLARPEYVHVYGLATQDITNKEVLMWGKPFYLLQQNSIPTCLLYRGILLKRNRKRFL